MVRIFFILCYCFCIFGSVLAQNTEKVLAIAKVYEQNIDSVYKKYNEFLFSQPDSTLKYALLYQALAKATQAMPLLLQSHLNLAKTYSYLAKPDSSIKYGLAGLNLNLKVQDKNQEIALNLLMSRINETKGSSMEAINYAVKAMNVAKEINDKKNIAKAAESIGNVYYFLLKDYKNSIKYYLVAADYYFKYDKAGSVGILNHLGNNHYQNKNYKEALAYYFKALEISQKANNVLGLGFTNDNIGLAYRKKNELQRALKYFEIGLSYRRKANNQLGIINSLHHLAKINLQLNNLTAANLYAEENKELSYQTNNYELILEALEVLVDIKEQTKNYEQALRYQKEIATVKDSLFKQQKESKVKELIASYELTQKEKENEILKKDNKQQQELLNSQQTVIWVAIISAILLLFMLLTIFKVRQKEISTHDKLLQTTHEIRQKNKLIEDSQRLLSQQNEELAQLNQVQNQLFAIIGHDLQSPITTLSGLLDITLSKDISQTEFLDLAHNLQQSVGSIHALVSNLFAWSKLQQQGKFVYPQNVLLLNVVQSKLKLFEIQASKKEIALVSNIPADIMLYADENHLQFILRNIIVNAIKFTPIKGKVSIEAKQSLDFVEITISDTGIGMSAKQVNDLLYTSQHTSTQGTAGEKGTGLGLLFCKDFISKNQGSLAIESKIGEGTTFYIKLPTGKNIGF
jgi:two-component system, sensor histidine kinase and response regulator